MIERPILFSTPMIQALLDGRKTQTRRIAKLTDAGHVKERGGHRRWHPADPEAHLACPYGQPGDSLWVRETHYVQSAGYRDGSGRLILYRATEPDAPCTWTPSIFMPRWASRLALHIIDVRIERLRNITEADAMAEGAMYHDGHGVGHSGWRHDYKDVHADARSSYARLWSEINGADSWTSNPWVWAVTFKTLSEQHEAEPSK